MIVWLHGKLKEKGAQDVILDCAGVGYGLSMTSHGIAALGTEGEDAGVWVHTHLSQESLKLYGFAQKAERGAFETLLHAPGVGPRLALAILSTLTVAELSTAVQAKDVKTLTRVVGVGAKKAERLLIELSDRLAPAPVDGVAVSVAIPSALSDVVSALVNLGFKDHVAEEAATSAAAKLGDEAEPSALVRHALRTLS